jgi:EAL domain-containing protein (putative c-di-GMP-specific phosphodiesterase class I)
MEFRREFKAGQTVFSHGERGDCAYVVESGRIHIQLRDGDRVIPLATRVPGELFGEMAIIDDEPRSADAVAAEDAVLLLITREQLNMRLQAADPILRMCMSVVLGHLRGMLRSLTDQPSPDVGPQVNPDARAEALSAIRLEQALEEAIKAEQFELNYQPLVEMKTGFIAGFEGLIRWRHPDRGLIPPGAFIPAAERSGLIIEMTHWAFCEGARAVQRLQKEVDALGETGQPPLFMSINFSGRDFADPNFLTRIDRELDEIGVEPSRMKLEITETLLMHNPESARKSLEACRARGASVAIDDFGTGYSSLSYLNNLPADTLKIDQSFVRGLDEAANQTLVRSINTLAQDLGMKVVAEGVEDAQTAAALRALGIDYGQGYYFSRPKPERDIVQLLWNWRRAED